MNTHARRSGTKLGAVLALTACLLLALLAGCASGGNSETANETDANAGDSNAGASAGPGAKTKITVAVQSQPGVEDRKTNLFTKMLEEEFNVDMEFVELPADLNEAKTKFALMVSSGTALPDVVNFPLDDVTAYDYASKGVFVKLDDYYNDPAVAVNYNAIPDPDKSFIYNNLKLADGSVYGLPNHVVLNWNEGSYRAWINSAWLEKLNLQAPATTDELYEVLKAFAEKDPNGNGKKDEIGIVGSKNGWGQNPLVYLMNSFIYANPDKGYLNVEDGQIVASFVQPEWKQGLEYMYKLVKDGLLSPLSFTQDSNQLKALVNVEGGMAGVTTSGSYSLYDPAILHNKMALLAPVKGPDGTAFTPYNPTLPKPLWLITRDSQNPQLAFRIGDYMLNQDVSKISRYGEKGVDWSDDPAITSQYIGDFEMSHGIKTEIAILNPKFWGNPQNKNWQDINPAYRPLALSRISSSTKRGEADPNASPNFQPAYMDMYVPGFPPEVIPKLSYTADELKKIANSKTAIDSYVTDTAVAFITGNMPLSQWDKYLSELDKMGLDDYLATAQAAYDRTK